MRDHPLTPMRDPSLVRVLQRQTTGRVGLVPYARSHGRRSRSAPPSTRCAPRVSGTRSSMRSPTRISRQSARRRPICLDHRRLGHRAGLAGEFSPPGPARRRRRRRQTAGGRRRGGGAVRVVLRGDQGQIAFMARTRAGLYDRPARGGSGGGHRGAGARLGGGAARRTAGGWLRQRAARRGRRRAAALGRERAGALVGGHHGAGRARGSSNAACGGSSWPAARPRARSCRRSASPDCASAARSTPACRGRVSLGDPPLALALKSGNFGAPDFFLQRL